MRKDRDLLTGEVIRAIVSDGIVRDEYVFAAIGPANARAATDEESAARLRELTEELAATSVLVERAPSLAAMSILGQLDTVDWSAVVTALIETARPRRRRFGARGGSV